jgi:hypothetical protein
MPRALYRLSNLQILLLFVCVNALLLSVAPRLLQSLPFLVPTEESTRLGQSLFSPIASSTGLLIGFLLNQAQMHFREVENLVSAEAGQINNLDRLLLRCGDPGATPLREKLLAYIHSILDEEWPCLAQGRGHTNTHLLWRSISRDLFKLEPAGPRQTAIYMDILKKAEQIAESREARVERSGRKLPGLFWIVIAIGVLTLLGVNVLFLPTASYSFGLLILPIAFGGLISLLVVTDRPYCGEHSVKPTALRTVLASIETRVV